MDSERIYLSGITISSETELCYIILQQNENNMQYSKCFRQKIMHCGLITRPKKRIKKFKWPFNL